MSTRHPVQFLGPTLHPISKWIIGFAILGVSASLLAFSLVHGLPLWLKALGWASIVALYWIGGSVYRISRRTAKDRRHPKRQSGFYPPHVNDWILDRSREETKH